MNDSFERTQASKIEQIREILNRYFENDPITGEPNPEYDDMLTAQGAIDEIVEALR